MGFFLIFAYLKSLFFDPFLASVYFFYQNIFIIYLTRIYIRGMICTLSARNEVRGC